MLRKQAYHDTRVFQRNAALAEEEFDFREGDRVMTVDGFPGKVTAVLAGPYRGTETYQVELDGGMGGGDYTPGQLRPRSNTTASRIEAAEVTSSVLVEATTDHTANVDYPELEDILERRPPNERVKLKVHALNTDKAAEPQITGDDPGENMDVPDDHEEPDANPVDDPEADPDNEAVQGQAQPGDVTPPSACSFCGHDKFGDQQMTGRGVRMRCEQCGGTMKSWGGQWEPEFPNSSQNHASETWDYRSGGPGGVVQAPGANFKTTKLRELTSLLSPVEAAESLQSEAGIVSWIFNRLYDKARAREIARGQDPWWQAPPSQVGTDVAGPAHYDLITPQRVSLGSVSDLEDPDWKWHFTATWFDVQAKARKIRSEGHVKIVAASNLHTAAEVQGDTATYETQLNYVPGTRHVADWSCGCKWGSYTWGRSPAYRRFEGRLCSHALATQYEASSRGMFGREVKPNSSIPDWQTPESPVVVQHDRSTRTDLSRSVGVPPKMRRTFSSRMIDTDGIYPEPDLLDLQHAPVYATVQTMIDNEANLVDVIEVVASSGIDKVEGKAMVFDALLEPLIAEGVSQVGVGPESGSASRSEASKQHPKKKKHVHQEHGRTWGYGLGWGWGACGMCGGSGCDNCHGTGQVPPDDAASTGVGGAVDAGGGDGSGATASLKTALDERDLMAHFHEHNPLPEKTHCGTCGAQTTAEEHRNWGTSMHPNYRCESCHAHSLAAEGWQDSNGEPTESRPAPAYDKLWYGPGEHHNELPYTHDRLKHFEVPDHLSDLPSRLNSQHTADYSSADPLVGLDGGHNTRPTVQHSNSENPGSTGWATSQDPGDWGRSLISNDFGVTFDAALHVTSASKDGPPTVSGVALKAGDTGRVLMIQRSNSDPKDPAAGTWEFPGGHHEEGDQTSLHAGIREFEEETGQRFPGGHLTHVHRSGPYVLHTVVTPSEKDIDFSQGRSEQNPDDPDGDNHEQAAWWDPDHAQKNPALRSELRKSNPFVDIKKAAVFLDPRNGLDRCHFCGRETEPHNTPGMCSNCEMASELADYAGGADHNLIPAWMRGEGHRPFTLGDSPQPLHSLNALDPVSDVAVDFASHLADEAMFHDEPQGALPSTNGEDEDVDAGPAAGNTSEGPFGLSSDEENKFTTASQRIILEFQSSQAGQKLAKQAMKDFTHSEQQELINEGRGDRARNFSDLRIAGTHYEMIGDEPEDETILWV